MLFIHTHTKYTLFYKKLIFFWIKDTWILLFLVKHYSTKTHITRVLWVLICIASLSVCDLNTTKMNVSSSLIWKLILLEFKLGHNAVKVTEDIYWPNGAVDHSTITTWSKQIKELNLQEVK